MREEGIEFRAAEVGDGKLSMGVISSTIPLDRACELPYFSRRFH